jgi:hypothetical protein
MSISTRYSSYYRIIILPLYIVYIRYVTHLEICSRGSRYAAIGHLVSYALELTTQLLARATRHYRQYPVESDSIIDHICLRCTE